MTCAWSEWIDLGKPTQGPDGGYDESIQEIVSAAHNVCSDPEEVQCRAAPYPDLSLSMVGQTVTCNKDVGVICINKQQGLQQLCFDYEIQFKCCGCGISSTPSTTVPTTTPSTTLTTKTSTTTETTTTPSTTPTTTTPTTTETTTTPSTTPTTTTPTTTETTTTPSTTPTTTTPTTTETTPTTTTPTTTETTTTPSTTPTTTTETTTTSQPPTSTPCPVGYNMTCAWSEWIDLGKPTQGPDGGYDESIQEIVSAAHNVCSDPEEVQCRAARYPDLSISMVGQTVTCNKDVGVICINKQQGFQQLCFDYEIQFKCCGCGISSTPFTTVPTTTPSTTLTTKTSTTTETTTTPSTTPTTTTPTTTETTSTPSTTPTTTTPTTTETTTTPSTTPTTTTPTTTETTTTPSTTPTTTTETTTTSQPPTSTPCPVGYNMTCAWSEWIDLGKPTQGPDGGYDESIQEIVSAAHNVCSDPEEVQCRAAPYPDLSLSMVGQTVTCNKDVGVICINKQQGLQQLCFDYEIQFKCCGCGISSTPSTTVPTTTPSTTLTTKTSTTTETTTTPSTTPTTTTPTTTETTTTPSTTPTTTTPTTTETTTTPSTTPTTTTPTTTETTPTTTTPTTTETTTTPSTTPTTTTETTTTSQPPTSTPCPVGYNMTCAWSEWIDLGKPTQGPDGGYDESIQEIVSAAHNVCSDPEEVQCRAAPYPDLSLSMVGQTVTCNKDVGVICINKQQGLQQLCFDYEIQFKCCGCGISSTPSTTVPTTTPSTTLTTKTSTTTETTTTPSTTPTTTTPTTTETTTTPSTTPTTTTPTTTETTTTPSTTPTTTTPTTTETTTTTPSTTPTTTTETTTTPSTTPTTTTPTTTETTTTTTPATSTITSPATTMPHVVTGETPTHPPTKPLCSCLHNGTSFNPDSIVYNVTDGDGYCYIGYCNESCHVVSKHTPCPKLCDTVTPPRQNGEIWMKNKCVQGRCDEGNVTYNKVPCTTPKPIVCANNFPYVEVLGADECCPKLECQCTCYGWGDPHYVTFDGTYYDFQGNCSYWLMKEISPKYNLSVMIDNYYCGDGLSCPQSIIVFYQSYKIYITQKDINGNFTNQVSVNDKQVSPAYQNDVFRIITTVIETVLVIPEIHAKVTFSGLNYGIYLPYSEFGGNTEGQCGTCDNNRTDDCMLPSGKIDPSCPDMAHEWRANNSYCDRVHPTPTPTPPPDTCNTTICEIIQSSVFERCHKKVDYSPFVMACKFDVCHMHINHIGCTSLQTYADACAEVGICIDWRTATKGICDYRCPSPKVYRACGPQVESTCESWYNQKFVFAVNAFSAMTSMDLEGCYCPNGTFLLSASSNECVPTCEICQLPNGKWTHANSTWIEGCKECICEEDTLQVTCRQVSCPAQPPLSCDQEGQVKVTDTVGCCQEEKCECNVTLCPPVRTCPIGYTQKITMGVCCSNVTCEIQNVCVYQNHIYQVGDMVLMKPCYNCICSNMKDASDEFHKIECQLAPCDTHCPLGYEYETVADQCCGKCVQTSCVFMLPNSNITRTLQPGTNWSPADNPCVRFDCMKIANQCITIEAEISCPPYNPEECIPGTETIAPNGCCRFCIPKGQCDVSTTTVHLESQGCHANELVNVTSCSGACGTFTFYSSKTRSLQHTCSCCQEVASSERTIQLSCPDNTKLSYTYIHIDSCGCLKTECSGQGELASTTSSVKTSNVKSSRRRR
ncbi:mucin-2-like [Cebidichthys violaceus]|uniref:mucin-2-like n=1 Tax=Cebidichthys violaceus TaxID=271503 RepID=UPI0035CA6375